jgi:GT2 family glycosyltransferase
MLRARVSDGTGAVVIGRNEGERLARCLRSLDGRAEPIVYVDSGSRDQSVELARGTGVEVVELDRSTPFTAARARNAGFLRLLEIAPQLELVQFVDGDCEVEPGWVDTARTYLQAHAGVAVVCGRRRERAREASVYNRLADIEWDTPVGETDACGGDAMVRVAAFRAVGGFDDALIAGEEPELCYRLRRAGGRIVRLPCEMTLHDAAMHRFGQWWRRSARAGHAYAECAYLHGREPARFRVREVASILAWGAGLPVLALAGTVATRGASLALLGAYAILAMRVYAKRRRLGDAGSEARLYAGATTLGKLAQLQGLAQFSWNRIVRRRRTSLIEYKTESPTRADGSRN